RLEGAEWMQRLQLQVDGAADLGRERARQLERSGREVRPQVLRGLLDGCGGDRAGARGLWLLHAWLTVMLRLREGVGGRSVPGGHYGAPVRAGADQRVLAPADDVEEQAPPLHLAKVRRHDDPLARLRGG